ncbi:alpha-amylase family glycosyl hydrolase, partial [Duncaniella freteri]|uniref:alpha-amylase family glycosyl hydrolase n=1 Tax=Duncaniella freteri TaxID=2530391 RepID=UPI00257328D7
KHNVSAAQLTGCWQCVDGIGDKMLNFLENHDEVRFASREYAEDPSKVIPSLVVSAMISKGPFMIYYGQELGEMAHDNEGFAGDNNRSTIFDYWSYDTLRRWYDNGRCSALKLTRHERWLRKLYKNVLTMCNARRAFREGCFFDLMYVNLRNSGFNPHRQYAFLRYTESEALLVVANFDDNNIDLSLSIPQLAIDMAGLASGKQCAKDLLWGRELSFEVGADVQTALSVKGHDAVIVPLKKRQQCD